MVVNISHPRRCGAESSDFLGCEDFYGRRGIVGRLRRLVENKGQGFTDGVDFYGLISERI